MFANYIKSTTAAALLFVMGLNTPLCGAETNHYNWVHVAPNDYPTAEQFFSKNDCRFFFTVAHFYDVDNEHWLSHLQAIELFPAAESVASNASCQPAIAKDEVANVFNIDFTDRNGIIMIYIGPHEKTFDVMFTPGSSLRTRYDEQQPILEALAFLPRYWVTTPMAGFRPQQ